MVTSQRFWGFSQEHCPYSDLAPTHSPAVESIPQDLRMDTTYSRGEWQDIGVNLSPKAEACGHSWEMVTTLGFHVKLTPIMARKPLQMAVHTKLHSNV